MNAGALIRAAGLDTEELHAELFPISVDAIRIRPAPALLRWMWPKGIGAMALPKRIYLNPPLLAKEPSRIGGLIVHELIHVRQWSDFGFWGFLRRYLGEYLRGRRQGLGHQHAYRSNRLEVEARQVEARYTDTI